MNNTINILSQIVVIGSLSMFILAMIVGVIFVIKWCLIEWFGN